MAVRNALTKGAQDDLLMCITRIQTVILVMIVVSVVIQKNRPNAEFALHIMGKTWFGQLKCLSDAVVSLWMRHNLNPWVVYSKDSKYSFSRDCGFSRNIEKSP